MPGLTGIRNILSDKSEQDIEVLSDIKQTYLLDLVEQKPMILLKGVQALIAKLRLQGFKIAAASSSKNASTFLQSARVADLSDGNNKWTGFLKTKTRSGDFSSCYKKT